MIYPKRYRFSFKDRPRQLNDHSYFDTGLKIEQTFEDGGWVMWEDLRSHWKEYEALRAEMQRLKEINPASIDVGDVRANPEFTVACFRVHRERDAQRIAELERTVKDLKAIITGTSNE